MRRTTRQRLVDTAYELFSHHGFHAVGLDQILSEVGVTKTTFYNHFESKDDLVLAVIRHRHEVEFKHLRQMLRERGGRSARGQLEAIFEVMDEFFRDPEFRGCIFISVASEFVSPTDPVHQAAAVHKEAVREMLCDLAAHAGAEDPETLADQLTLLIDGAIVVRHVTGSERAALTAGQMASLLLDQQLPAGVPRRVPAAVAAGGGRLRLKHS